MSSIFFVLQETAPNWDGLFEHDVIVPLAGCAIGLVAVIGYFWSRSVRVKSEAELKRSMIERGMSAEEIERVIDAGTGRKSGEK